jgi:negative regulator of sigma E activity
MDEILKTFEHIIAESPWLAVVIAVAAVLLLIVILLVQSYSSRKRRGKSDNSTYQNLKELEYREK